MRKKILSLALALVMCLGLTVPALACDMGKVGENNTISAGGSNPGLIDQNGSLWMWGGNSCGQLGNGSKISSSTPVKVMDSVAAVSCGGVYFTAAIKTDGSLWMWGINSSGQLGNNGGSNATTSMGHSCQTVPVKVMDNVAAVSCGYSHTAAIKTDGSLWMWGGNEFGQLGNGGGGNATDKYDVPYQTVPVKVLDNVAAVSCGGSHTAAVKTDGSLWMWGYNYCGELGNGGGGNAADRYGIPYQTVPVKVLDNVAAVSCGLHHTAAIKTDGSLWMWGDNVDGQLGNGSGTESSTPVKVMDSVAAVSCGWYCTAAVKTDGSLWMWGSNGYGQLGNGGGSNHKGSWGACQTVPVKVMDSVAAVSCSVFTAAVRTDGSLWTWGENSSSGQLGYQDFNAEGEYSVPIQTVPKQVAGLTVAVSAASPALPTTTPSTTTTGFSDVKTSDYFAEPVAWAVEKGITAGTSTTTFSPDLNCTQGQILAFLWRAKGEPAPVGTVSGSEFYVKAAQWAKEQGLTDNFSAEADCTRAMVVTYLWKLAGSPNAGTPDYTDVPANADYAQAVAWAVKQGITSGIGNGQFAPNSVCSRGQIVSFLYRAMGQ